MAPRQKTFTYGTCGLDHLSPPATDLSASTQTINVIVSFEEALKLSLAINEGLRTLNKHDRATREGRDAAMCLTVHLDKKRITVNPGKVRVTK